MDSLTNLFSEPKEFNVESCNEGEKTFVGKLVSRTTELISGMEVNSKLTLYISLAKAVDVNSQVTIDPNDFNYFTSEFMPEDSDEIFELKWITPSI